MYKKLKRACFVLSLTGLALGLIAGPAAADTMQIQFTGVNLVYDGTNLFDAQLSNIVGNGDPAQSDPLTSLTVLHNSALVGSVITSDIFTDVYIKGLVGIPAAGGLVISTGNGGAFGVDVLTNSATPGWGLALQINTAQLFYSGGGMTFVATGLATSVFNQSLPFGAAFDVNQPITFVFSSLNLSGLKTDNGVVTGFTAEGTGVIAGTGNVVPEPSTLVLLGVGVISLFGYGWRRRWA